MNKRGLLVSIILLLFIVGCQFVRIERIEDEEVGAEPEVAEKVEEVLGVYWLEELGMPEAAWIFKVKEFGPLVVAIDSHGKSIYKELKKS